ncbi:MAG TPA: ABC transporter permease [Polyangiaceae bacterium]|nr:ABC transporter permease [Polyangiaceae bacterium]
MTYLARRLGWSIITAWTVVSITFALNELLPGDPARMVAGLQARPADVARIRDRLGLDKPPIVRYARFWQRLVHLGRRPIDRSDPAHATCAIVVAVGPRALHVDFGKSFQMGLPVVDLVSTRLPRTVALGLAAVAVQLVLGASIGTAAALRPGSAVDRLLVGASLLGVSAPTFLIAIVLQTLFARGLRWLPFDGFGATLGEHARCLVLPALTLGIYGAAYYTRLIRDEMLVLMRLDWIRTARAKGAPVWRVVIVHAFRNALVPILTAAGLDLGALLGGAVVTETVFRWPGLGELSVRAALDRDGPVLCASVIAASLAVVATNLAVDLAYSRLDPRIIARRARDSR